MSQVDGLLARASELYKADPLMSYCCKLRAIQRILDTKEHLTNDTVAQRATSLMEDIENTKSTLSSKYSELLDDEVAMHAYVSNFANKVFDHAAKAMVAKRVDKSTSRAFIAASTFFDVEAIWSPLEASDMEKVKFAKFHAARILRAIAQGEDPNLSSDAEQSEISKKTDGDEEDNEAKEDATNENEPQDENVAQDSESAADTRNELEDGTELPNVKDLLPPSAPTPEPEDEESQLSLPETPQEQPNDLRLPHAPESAPSVPFAYDPAPKAPRVEEFEQPQPEKRPTRNPAPRVSRRVSQHNVDYTDIIDEVQTISQAQKHARYAISALNYEDIDTAVKELRSALKLLDSS